MSSLALGRRPIHICGDCYLRPLQISNKSNVFMEAFPYEARSPRQSIVPYLTANLGNGSNFLLAV